MATHGLAMEACGVDAGEYDRLMSLSYDAFDQDFEGGWRAVDSREGCSPVAAHLIAHYLQHPREIPLTPDETLLLNWHAGQVTAYTSHSDALPYFYKTFEDRPADVPSDWDLYVTGTIAFLEGNQGRLEQAYSDLSQREVSLEEQQARQAFLDANPNIQMPAGFVKEPNNLAALRGLKRCFGKSYKLAYTNCAHQEN